MYFCIVSVSVHVSSFAHVYNRDINFGNREMIGDGERGLKGNDMNFDW